MDLAENNVAKCGIAFAAAGCKNFSAQVLNGSRIPVIELTGNRMHAQKGLLLWLAIQHGQLAPEDLQSEGIELPTGFE